MTKQTTSLSLSKPEITDKIVDTITQLASNFDVIDSSLAESSQRGKNIWIDVKADYGAVGNANYFKSADGNYYQDSAFTKLATDDTLAFQNALNYLVSFGKVVSNRPVLYIPNGNYLVGAITTLQNVQNLRIVGQDEYATQLNIKTGTSVFISLGIYNAATTNYWNGTAQGFTIENLSAIYQAYYSFAFTGTRTCTFLQDNGSGSVTMKNVDIRGFKNAFYGAYGSDFTTILNCNFFENDLAVYLGCGSQQVLLDNNQFSLNGESVVLERASHGTIRSCYFMDSKLSDIDIECNTTTRSGVATNLSGLSSDYTWSFENCWHETGAGYDLTNYGFDLSHHIIITGNDTAPAIPRGIYIKNPYLVSGSSGLPAKSATPHSFLRIELGTKFSLENLTITGNRVDYAVDILSGKAPKIIQKDTRVADGYSVPLWNNFTNGCVYIDSLNNAATYGVSNAQYDLTAGINGNIVRLKNNADGSCSILLWDGTAWRDRINFDIASSAIRLGDTRQTIRFSGSMPASGSYYKAGDIVYNNGTMTILGTTGSQYVLHGWRRLTTSSNHVLNTDWVEMRMPTGT